MKRTILLPFTIAFFLLILVLVLNRITFTNMQTYTKSVLHTQQVISQFYQLSSDVKSGEAYTKTYQHIPQSQFYNIYLSDLNRVHKDLSALQNLVKDNPPQLKLVDSVHNMILGQINTLYEKNIAEIITSGELWRLNVFIEIHEYIEKGIANERSLLDERTKKWRESTTINNLLSILLALFAVGILVFTFISNFFIQRKNIWLEDFLESILNTSQDGIIHYKGIREHHEITDFRVEYANSAVESLFGKLPSKIVGKKISEFDSHINKAALFDKYKHVIATGEAAQFELLFARDREEFWFIISLVKLDDGVTATFHDITKLKKYEEELKHKIKQLERSNEELEQYAYVASHDLQEPLRKLKTFGGFLNDTQRERLDEKGQLQLSKMLAAAERMSTLIYDLLNFSSLQKHVEFVSVNLNEVVEGALTDLELALLQSKAVITKDDLPVVEAIPLQVGQLFYNLLNNSLKFANKDIPPEISITCSHTCKTDILNIPSLDASLPYYKITVQDNGIGFNQEYAFQIFGLFKRLHDRNSYKGAGIGLALCKKVMLNHHGDILAEGNEGKGASFHIYIPEKQPVK
jgi:PAS domain S-box-containing protein